MLYSLYTPGSIQISASEVHTLWQLLTFGLSRRGGGEFFYFSGIYPLLPDMGVEIACATTYIRGGGKSGAAAGSRAVGNSKSSSTPAAAKVTERDETSMGRQSTQLLKQIEGVGASNDKVFLLCATN